MSEINYTTSRQGKKNLIFGAKTFYMRGTPKRTKDGALKEYWVCTANNCAASLTMVDGEIVKSSTIDFTHKCTETKRVRTDVDLIKFKVSVSNIICLN